MYQYFTQENSKTQMLSQIILANVWGRNTLDLHKLFWKIVEEEPLPNSFYKVSITLMIEPKNDMTKRRPQINMP